MENIIIKVKVEDQLLKLVYPNEQNLSLDELPLEDIKTAISDIIGEKPLREERRG
jgi:hypothetical protein